MINLFNIDCMKFMKDKSDNFYELAIVDPPYGAVNKMVPSGGTSALKNKMGKWDHPPEKKYFVELFRISKYQIIWGGNYFTDKIPISSRWVVWQKTGGLKNFPQFEMAWTNTNIPNKIFTMSRADSHINERITCHPTEKPIKLYKWLLKNYAKPGDKILDTHGGSMSIAIACADMGFDLDLCELDKDYFKAGKKRYEKHISQIRMF